MNGKDVTRGLDSIGRIRIEDAHHEIKIKYNAIEMKASIVAAPCSTTVLSWVHQS